MLDFVFENQTNDKKWHEDFFKDIVYLVLAELGLSDKHVETGLYLVTPDRSQELNRTHRHKDMPTNVLSFPINDGISVKHDIILLGDIFICPAVAMAEVQDDNQSLESYMARLTVHGLLHLAGYDHESGDQKAKQMVDLEENILKKLNSHS